ncbi:MAG: hypothetical protein M0Z95_26880 [Actinomycetota bacterium]|nr:hypothetical protein [Actinomycetota bacterium]
MDDAEFDAKWRNDDRRLRAELSRATGYAGELDDIDEPVTWADEHPEPDPRMHMPPSVGPESDFWPGDDDDEDNNACPSELRPGTVRQMLWSRPWADVGVSWWDAP